MKSIYNLLRSKKTKNVFQIFFINPKCSELVSGRLGRVHLCASWTVTDTTHLGSFSWWEHVTKIAAAN